LLADLQRVVPPTNAEGVRTIVEAGDILVSITADIGSVGIVPEGLGSAYVSQHLALVRLNHRLVDPRFVAYSLSSKVSQRYLEESMQGGTKAGLNLDDVRDLPIHLPQLVYQKVISSYLDRKTAAIDALIEKKQKLVELLAEKQRSVVDNQLWQDEACNKEVQLVYLVSLLSGFAAQSEHFSREDRDIRLLRGVNISPNGLRWDDVVRWPAREAGKLKRYLMRPGDIVLGMDRPWISDGLRIATIQEQDCPCLLVQRVARLRVGAHLSSRYLKMALQSKRFQSHLEPETTGVSVPHISGEQILSFRVPLPSLERQDSISASLCSEISKLEELIRKVVDQICRLQEYRQSLITAAVTGQLEIPEEPQE